MSRPSPRSRRRWSRRRRRSLPPVRCRSRSASCRFDFSQSAHVESVSIDNADGSAGTPLAISLGSQPMCPGGDAEPEDPVLDFTSGGGDLIVGLTIDLSEEGSSRSSHPTEQRRRPCWAARASNATAWGWLNPSDGHSAPSRPGKGNVSMQKLSTAKVPRLITALTWLGCSSGSSPSPSSNDPPGMRSMS